MDYSETSETRSLPLLLTLKKRMAKRKLKRGKPVSSLTKGTKKEVKGKHHLVLEAKRLMKQVTPCAESLDDIQLDSDEYIEDSADEEHTDEEHTDEEHTDEEHADEEHTDEEHTDEEHTDEEIDVCASKNKEHGTSPIHMHLLDNELECDFGSVCDDTAVEAADVEYENALSSHDKSPIKDDELDIIDSEFQFIN